MLRVEGNIIATGSDILQISSISRVWTGYIRRPKKSLVFGIIFLLIGIVSFSEYIKYKDMSLGIFAGCFIVAGALCILGFMLKKVIYVLNIQLNSGLTYSCGSNVEQFISEAFMILQRILLDGNKSNENYLFNFGEGTIVNNSENVQVER